MSTVEKLGAWSGAERVQALPEPALELVGSRGRRLRRRWTARDRGPGLGVRAGRGDCGAPAGALVSRIVEGAAGLAPTHLGVGSPAWQRERLSAPAEKRLAELPNYRRVVYPLAVSRQPRIVITPDYNRERLMREIAAQQGQTVVIVGVGARVIREFPYGTLRVPASDVNPRRHAVVVDLHSLTSPLTLGHEPGKPPVVERAS